MAGRIGHPKQLAEQVANARAQASAATDPDIREHFEAIAADGEDRLRRAERCIACGSRLEDPESKQRGIGPDCFARLLSTPAGALRGAPASTYPDPEEPF